MTDDVLPAQPPPQPLRRRPALKVSLLTLGAAVPAGLCWWLVAPLPRLQVTPSGLLLAEGDSEAFIAADAWFAICTAVAGAICAVAAFVLARGASPVVVLWLAVGGCLAAVVSWRLGVLLGPPAVDVPGQGLAVGDRIEGPLDLSARGVLLAWPLVSVTVYFSLVAGLDVPPPRPPAASGRHRRK